MRIVSPRLRASLVKTLAVIPARLGATRLPQKPLRLLAGVPLVVRVLERVRALRVADRCIVATDSELIRAEVLRAGGEALLTDEGHPSGTDRVAEVAARADCRGYGAILNVQGDEPFVAAEAVRGALVLDEVARREQMAVAQEDVDAEIARYAERTGRTPAAVRARLEKEGGLGRLYSGLRR